MWRQGGIGPASLTQRSGAFPADRDYYSSRMKPKVYVETTVVGHLTSRLPNDIVVAGQMLVTRQW